MELQQRTIILTGAAGGIGGGITEVLLAQGARVVRTEVDGSGLGAARARLDHRGDRTVEIVADLRAPSTPDTLVAAALDRFERLDGLVNNAGTIAMDAAFDATTEAWSDHFDVNLTAAFSM